MRLSVWYAVILLSLYLLFIILYVLYICTWKRNFKKKRCKHSRQKAPFLLSHFTADLLFSPGVLQTHSYNNRYYSSAVSLYKSCITLYVYLISAFLAAYSNKLGVCARMQLQYINWLLLLLQPASQKFDKNQAFCARWLKLHQFWDTNIIAASLLLCLLHFLL